MRVSADVGVAGERTREPARAPAPSWLSPLSLLRTRFRCSALTPLTFAPRELGYKGNAFHTRFEAALARVSSAAYELLCGQPDASRKPYVLVPPLDGLIEYPPTLRFDVELLLVGAAVERGRRIMAAFFRHGEAGGAARAGRKKWSRNGPCQGRAIAASAAQTLGRPCAAAFAPAQRSMARERCLPRRRHTGDFRSRGVLRRLQGGPGDGGIVWLLCAEFLFRLSRARAAGLRLPREKDDLQPVPRAQPRQSVRRRLCGAGRKYDEHTDRPSFRRRIA